MKTPTLKVAVLVGIGALATATLTACGGGSTPQKSSSSSAAPAGTSAARTTSAAPVDYVKFLIKETDIVAPEVFTAKPPISNPGGQPGVSAAFSNADGSNVIGDTILVFPDEATANAALEAATAALSESVDGEPESTDIGTGGTIASGNSPDGSKSVTVVLFTEGRTFTTLEFDGPPDADAPEDFVADIAEKQDDAIKAALTS